MKLDFERANESAQLEFKEKLPSAEAVARTLVAFANGGGGELVIGVRAEPQELVGVPPSDALELEERICAIAYDRIAPPVIPLVRFQSVDSHVLVIVRVERGSQPPYYLKNLGVEQGTYIRVGSSTRQATPEIIAELERRRLNLSFDATPCWEARPSDLNPEHLSWYFAQREKVRGIPPREPTPDLLLKLRLLVQQGNEVFPSVGGVLLFCDSGADLFPQAVVKCARFRGTEPSEFIDQKEVRTPLLYQTEEALKFFRNHIPRGARIEGAYRQEEWAFPEVAAREAITNAICHRDYSISGSDIKFAIYDDIMEVTSPGDLPPGITLEDLGTGVSELRNRVIGRVFAEVGLIEQWGTGIHRMRQALSRWGLPGPEYSCPGRFVQVAFSRQIASPPVQSEPVENELHRQILEHLSHSPASTAELMKTTGRSRRSVQKHLHRLAAEGIIEWTGTSKHDPTGVYRMIPRPSRTAQ